MGGNINAFDAYGFTQVHYAVRRSKLNILKWLVANGGNENVPSVVA